MKISIRKGVFETNSSNTHILTLFSAEDWQKYVENELFREDGCNIDTFITREEAIRRINKIIISTITEQSEKDKPDINVERVKEEYYKINQANHEDLIKFINDITEKSGKTCIFRALPITRQEYINRKDHLECDVTEKVVNGKMIVAECFHGRSG